MILKFSSGYRSDFATSQKKKFLVNPGLLKIRQIYFNFVNYHYSEN